MPPFRWKDLENDTALCRQFVGDKPGKPSEWNQLASTLSVFISSKTKTEVSLIGRGCKEHMELLVKKFKNDERKALKRSGTEEEVTELLTLLEDITSYLESRKVEHEKVKVREAEDQKKGLEMRKAALETYRKAQDEESEEDVADEDADEDDEEDTKKRKRKTNKKVSAKKGRGGKNQLLDYLVTKQNDSMAIKERQLELEERRIALEEKKMEMEKLKWSTVLANQNN